MRSSRTLLALLVLPALALAQGREPAVTTPATGRYLLAALPPPTDLVLHTPDLPALLAAARDDGVGDAQAWRAAFREQMTAWGARSGAPDTLLAGAERLLAAADGEALLASWRMPPYEGPPRATVLAFRTTQREDVLRAALARVFEGGLIAAYPGVPGDEQIGGRPVIAYAGVHDRLYVLVQDGLVVAGDHPLALGLLFRGLERAAEPEPAGDLLLEVRHGRGADAWSGWTYGDRESVSWRSVAERPLTAPLPAGLVPVVAVALSDARDAPLFPVRAPEWLAELPTGGPVGRLVALTRGGGFAVCGARSEGLAGPLPSAGDDGRLVVLDDAWAVVHPAAAIDAEAAAAGAPAAIPGGAARLGWLRGWADGSLPPPIPGVDRARFRAPAAAGKGAARDGGPFVAWQATDRPGELRGPRWNGPTTFLALRTLHDIATKTGPGTAAARARAEAPKPRAGATLPPPVEPRPGGDDAR